MPSSTLRKLSSTSQIDNAVHVSRSIQTAVSYRLGYAVGSFPVLTILLSLFVAGALMVGFIRFQQENRPEELWIPTNVDTVDNLNLVYYYFPEVTRGSYLIITAGNDDDDDGDVLTPAVMRKVSNDGGRPRSISMYLEL